MLTLAWLIAFVVLAMLLAYHRTPLWLNSLALAGFLIALTLLTPPPTPVLVLLWALLLVVMVPLNIPPLRRLLVSNRLLGFFRKVLPPISATERAALEAGTVWWDGELFSGRPDWQRLQAVPAPTLTAEEQAFLDGPANELCAMLDEWEITHRRFDLPPKAWDFIKQQGFMGMIIPKEYGGLGFSAYAHSQVVMKINSRSPSAGATVSVPNSLGPAELLLQYGTEQQRDHYLPRLARGDEIPCFALTGPEAGSDAGSMPDYGIVCRGEFEGREIVGIRLNWEKRYITLGPIATVLGLAFKLYDPDRLLSERSERGITLALIPTSTPGIEIGRRHYPLDSAFMNGPNSGHDVFIPLDYIIGGEERIGQGWAMLMNCLSAGRSISLPAAGAAAAKFATALTGAYARVRKQFNRPIGEFEGIQEVLARMGGNTYAMDATRSLTAVAVDQGEKPAVLSAIVKYHLTERARLLLNDAMDVHGGKGICLGPSNYLGRAYQSAPVSITVEGANILTRNMMIFGQGALRCHPYLLREVMAAQDEDRRRGRREFDRALLGHVGFVISNKVRALLLGLTDGRLTARDAPEPTRRYYQQLSRLSAAFALVADITLMTLGGALKRKERLSARLGDMLSLLYIGSAVLKRYEDQGRPEADLALVDWAMHDTLYRLQEALLDVLSNFPNRFIGGALRLLTQPLGRSYPKPSDRLEAAVAELLLSPTASRERLAAGVYLSTDQQDAAGRVEYALGAVLAAEAVEDKIDRAERSGHLKFAPGSDRVEPALAAGLIDPGEAELLREAQRARRAVIMVDDFAREELENRNRAEGES